MTGGGRAKLGRLLERENSAREADGPEDGGEGDCAGDS
jgi:hypothetical protein